MINCKGENIAKFRLNQYLLYFLSRQNFKFIWDEGNRYKNLYKHNISCPEAEQAFFDKHIAPAGIQIFPLCAEDRYGIIGKTKNDDILFVVFTLRNLKIRIISARLASKNERSEYEQKKC